MISFPWRSMTLYVPTRSFFHSTQTNKKTSVKGDTDGWWFTNRRSNVYRMVCGKRKGNSVFFIIIRHTVSNRTVTIKSNPFYCTSICSTILHCTVPVPWFTHYSTYSTIRQTFHFHPQNRIEWVSVFCVGMGPVCVCVSFLPFCVCCVLFFVSTHYIICTVPLFVCQVVWVWVSWYVGGGRRLVFRVWV